MAKLLLQRYSNATGLFIQWTKSESHWLADDPHPAITDNLWWHSTTPEAKGALLGFSFRDGLSNDIMFEAMLERLRNRLHLWNSHHLTLRGKIIVANHFISTSLWYFLTLNALHATRLTKLRKLLVAFIWGGREQRVQHRVAANIISLPRLAGGLGLIDISVQAKALSARIFLWSIQAGMHPLCWIRFQLQQISKHTYGLPSFSCLLTPRIHMPHFCSPILRNMLSAWFFFYKYLSL